MITRITIVVAFAALIAAGCTKKESGADGTMTMADSMKNAFRAEDSVGDAGKVDEFDKYITSDYIEHSPMAGQEPGLAGLKKLMVGYKAAFPDMKTTIEDMRVDGDVLTARETVSGTNSGPMMGMPATNKKLTGVMLIEMMRWQNGKFVEHWAVFDDRAMMTQLGLMHPPPSAPAADSGMKKKM